MRRAQHGHSTGHTRAALVPHAPLLHGSSRLFCQWRVILTPITTQTQVTVQHKPNEAIGEPNLDTHQNRHSSETALACQIRREPVRLSSRPLTTPVTAAFDQVGEHRPGARLLGADGAAVGGLCRGGRAGALRARRADGPGVQPRDDGIHAGEGALSFDAPSKYSIVRCALEQI